MNFYEILNRTLDYFQANPLIAVVAAITLVLLLIRRPQLFLVLACLSTVLLGFVHLVWKLSLFGIGSI